MDDGKFNEKDDFWAIEKLIPKERKPRVNRIPQDTAAVEICVGGQRQESNEGKLTLTEKFVPRPQSAPAGESCITPDDEYSPVSPLIEKVRVFRWKNNYNYYEEFRRDTLRYYHASSTERTHVPYFSYVPQYVQLSHEQLAWYLWWRSCVRNGSYPEVDYSYIILLVSEIINLGQDGDVYTGQRILCGLHRNYRKEYPRLDLYLSEWICDYSLIHHLPPPGDCGESLYDCCSLKEFYVYFEGSDAPDSYARLLMRYCSNYDFRKSKFATSENLPLYEKHIPAALSRAIGLCSDSGQLLSGAGLESNTLTRDAFTGALCASEIKRRIEVSFFSFSRSHELRFLVADIIKYCENRIRAYLGIKSRLGVFGLPKNVTSVLDSYFSENLPVIRRSFSEEAVPEQDYDRLYDSPKTELSPANAVKIEEKSWSTTHLLVEAFDGEPENPEEPKPVISKDRPELSCGCDSPQQQLLSLLGEKYAFIEAARKCDYAAQQELARRLSMLQDALADSINDIAADIVGDIILEETENGYTIIEDYTELF